jgi:hypothetical protein
MAEPMNTASHDSHRAKRRISKEERMRTRLIPLVTAILAISSIADAQPIHVRLHARRPADAAATLEVTNDNRQAVSVVMLLSGDEYPLGTVNGKRTRVVEVPSDLVGAANVTVLVTPIIDKPVDGSQDFQSAPITLAPGHEATLHVARRTSHEAILLVTSPGAQSKLALH